MINVSSWTSLVWAAGCLSCMYPMMTVEAGTAHTTDAHTNTNPFKVQENAGKITVDMKPKFKCDSFLKRA